MNAETLIKHLTEREHELERKRTRQLATQSWGDVIDSDARIAECKRLRNFISTHAETEVKP